MRAFLLIAMASIALVTQAQPPQEAIDACRQAPSGSSCSFSTPRGQMKGTCRQPPHERRRLCIPENRSQRPATREAPSQRPPSGRQHSVVQSNGEVKTVRADTQPVSGSEVETAIRRDQRILKANGISEHLTGRFPNQGNPNSIREQEYSYKVPANPIFAGKITPLGMHNFGLGVNGVPFDPGAAEWYLGDRRSGWQYEALSGAIALGLDDSYAHVQPNGAYHYHGLPELLTSRLDVASTSHSPLLGWAADGFPIYALYGYKDGNDESSGIVKMTSSYRLRKGNRQSGGSNPGGYYDGTFVADYLYVKGAGSLDECNGRTASTPEFPNGTYAYFLTESFPVVPRCYKGTPSTDFTLRR